MGQGILTLYDVPATIRAKGAAEARKQLLQLQANPHLNEEQRADLRQRLQWCSKWEQLKVGEVLPPPAPAPTPPAEGPTEDPPSGTNHSVDLSETLSVAEGEPSAD